MTNVICREDILRQQLTNVKEGELVFELLKMSDEFGYKGCVDKFSLAVQSYIKDYLRFKERFLDEHLYTYVMNVCYVVELYLKGYLNKERYMGYEEFLNIVDEGRTRAILDDVRNVFVLHINRLKKVIVKAKKRIPRDDVHFRNTKELLKEIDGDLSICLRYPTTSANLSTFYFGRHYGTCGTALVTKLIGFLNMEKEVYSLYNELCILSKLDNEYIDSISNQYINYVGSNLPFNLFERVINNYLFAMPYSDNPEIPEISIVDAKLLMKEIKMGTLSADELIEQFIEKFELEGYRAEYLREYGRYIQERINDIKDSNYFSELFLVIPPDWPKKD